MGSRAMPKSDSSLCEKSMELVANIIKQSSFSIAVKTFGSGTASGKTRRGLSTWGSEYADTVLEKEQMVPDQLYERRRSRRPTSRPNPTYVTYPVLSDGSASHVEEQEAPAKHKKEESVDLLAAKYIEKTRKRLGCVSRKT